MKSDDAIDAVSYFWDMGLGGSPDWCVPRFTVATGKRLAIVDAPPALKAGGPVGGFVLHGGLLEIGVAHQILCMAAGGTRDRRQDRQLCAASHLKKLS